MRSIVGVLILSCVSLVAQTSSEEFEIDADEFIFGKEEGVYTYRGGVVLHHKNIRVFGEELLVITKDDDIVRIEIKKSSVPGRIEILEKGRKAMNMRAGSIVLDVKTSLLTLRDNVFLNDGNRILQGGEVVINMKTKAIQATGGKNRVRMKVFNLDLGESNKKRKRDKNSSSEK